MTLRLLASAAVLALALDGYAAGVRVRDSGFQRLAQPDGSPSPAEAPQRSGRLTPAADADFGGPLPFLAYPVAGIPGSDLAIPYYVDLDDTAGKLDWNCGDMTFNGHTGHDAYIRSFTEQQIGVPLFAPRDGVVVEVHESEPDENTLADPAFVSNYVILDHGNGQTTRFNHLRRDSVPFAVGDRVSAGTQIGLIGSSGPSTAPHVHWEARMEGDVYEPMAGPCRAGSSNFTEPQEELHDEPIILGATLSAKSFADYRSAPWNDTPSTGTFVRGNRTIYFRTEVANVGASTRYKLMLDAPGAGGVLTASSGLLTRVDTSLGSIWWALDADLDKTGTWTLRLEINEREQFSFPFTVVSSSSQVVNRAPAAVTASITPVAIRSGQVAVCRADGSLVGDPDYDVVRYRYEWRSGGQLVRSVTSAARTDLLARELVRAGADLSCTVTPGDGKLEGPAVTAYATVLSSHRRAVRQE